MSGNSCRGNYNHGEWVDHHVMVDVPNKQQHGTKDCSVFAIAYAYHASLGDDLTTIMFDQTKMREHLERSFRLGILPHSTGYKPKEMHFPLAWNRSVLFLSNARDMGWRGMLWILWRMVSQWCINLKSIPNSEEQWFVVHVGKLLIYILILAGRKKDTDRKA